MFRLREAGDINQSLITLHTWSEVLCVEPIRWFHTNKVKVTHLFKNYFKKEKWGMIVNVYMDHIYMFMEMSVGW